MKNKSFAVIIFIVYNFSQCFAQNKTYLGIEASITNDIYEFYDSGNNLKASYLIDGSWGFKLRHEINNILFFETGLIKKYYVEGLGFKSAGDGGEGNAFDAWLIPFDVGTKFNISKGKTQIFSIIGYTQGINTDYGSYGWSSGFAKSGSDSINYDYSSNPSLSYTFPLLKTSLGVEFCLRKTLLFCLSVSHYSGFKKIVHFDINYYINSAVPIKATSYGKGEFWSLDFNLKYPISNLWANR